MLDVRNLTVHFPIGRTARLHAVDDVTFSIRQGETLGLVGESGCGKSTLGRAILRLVKPTGGSVLFDGTDLSTLQPAALRRMRARMQIIFQDSYASLDPRMRIGSVIAEPLIVHGVRGRGTREARVAELLSVVGLPKAAAQRFAHEFSGGQRQRVNIARALALNPDFLVCDEPISAVDVSIQADIINLLEDLQAEFALTYLFISHDLAMVRHISDRIAVMYLGQIVELGGRDEIFSDPLHPYTQALLSAVPIPDPVAEAAREQHRVILSGELPSAVAPPAGCRFAGRCPFVAEVRQRHGIACEAVAPRLAAPPLAAPSLAAGDGHWVACHRSERSRPA